jgi:hypothetical protein
VYVSEIYELLDVQPLVDYAEPTGDLGELTVEPGRAERLIVKADKEPVGVSGKPDEKLVGVTVKPDELVSLSDDLIELTIRKT